MGFTAQSLAVLAFAAALSLGLAGQGHAQSASQDAAQDAAQGQEREQVRANFLAADADGDGALTLSEFRTLIDLNAEADIGRASLVKRFGRYEMAFDRVDADGDGAATTDEIAAMAEQAGG